MKKQEKLELRESDVENEYFKSRSEKTFEEKIFFG